ncbi:MAG: tRNA (N6-isopentenyl adenosine(37)-C2)-methylthiotransferase MiaB [Clostridiales bacterium]|nr:tRNA (N6-isopentenyl adenosine(37)-C2)-methylthiotransferase MiaB [Clostridiales bacterium]
MKKFFINTYGCQMNVHESEKLAGILHQRGYVQANSNEDADVILLNTCCIRETAETRVLGNLGIIKKIKEKRPEVIVGICGCMPQKPGSAQMLRKRCPFINIIFGTHNMYRLGEYLDRVERGEKVLEIWDSEGKIETSPILREQGAHAWVNIMYGCDNFCSYCIVPYVRGRERSRDFNEIVTEVRALVESGYKEITLLGQNVNSYGGGSPQFGKLLRALTAFDGEYRIKFMTSHPKDFTEDVAEAMASSEKIANYVHLPVQAGSDRILKLMNRKYTSAEYLEKIKIIRSFIPDVGISSDIMIGFPTETEEDYLCSEELVKEVKYNNLFTFIYSRRSGTVADKMDGQVDIATKTDRIERLIKLQFEIGNELAKSYVGNKYRVLCGDVVDGVGYGKSSCDKSISFAADESKKGKFIDVKIIQAKNNKLIGEIC